MLFLAGFTMSYYYEWRYDAGTKRIFQLVAEQNQNRFGASHRMQLGVNWKSAYSFDFYRRMYHADWLERVGREHPPSGGGFDYYVLLPEDDNVIAKFGLRVVYQDPISGQKLAVPDSRPVLSSHNRM